MGDTLRAFLACLLASITINSLRAQDPVTIRYTVDDGLPSNEVHDAYEDAEGNVWFATDHGISRFDGYTFKNYTQQDGLACNTIFEFEEDLDGRVWMRGFDGSLSYLEHGRIRPYPHNDRLKSQLRGKFFDTMVCGAGHRMYVTLAPAEPQTLVLDLMTGRLDTLQLPQGNHAGLMDVGRRGQPLIAVSARMNPAAAAVGGDKISCTAAGKFWPVELLGMHKQYQLSRAMGVQLGKDRAIAAVADQLFGIDGCQISAPSLLPQSFNAITQDRDGQVWLSTRAGLHLINADLSIGSTLFPKETVFDLMHDSNRSYWICTLNGVLLVRNMAHRVYDQIQGEPLQNINRLQVHDSTLYVLCSRDSVLAAKLSPDGLKWGEKRILLPRGESNHDLILLPKIDRLIAGRSTYSLASGKEMGFPGWPTFGFPAWQFRQRGDHLLMAGSFGYSIFDLRRHKLLVESVFQVSKRFHTSILEDAMGNVWVGTGEGLFKLSGDTLLPYRHEEPIMRARVTDMAALGNGILVVATRGEGIFAFDEKHIWNIREEHGLASNMCNRLYLGPSGLWVCSNRGLSLISSYRDAGTHTSHGAILNYNRLDGLPSNKVNDIVEFGNIAYIATDKGIVAIHKLGHGPARIFPATKITHILADGRNVELGGALTPEEDNLEFRFQGRLLPALGNVQYRYRLRGYDHAWRMSEGHSAYYYDLPPGPYTFEVSAIYPYAAQNPNFASSEVYLPPKLHERWWFRLAAVLVTVVAACLVIWLYMRGRNRRTENNLRRLQAEIKALRSQMRPHFIFNALNSIQHLIKSHDNATAETHLLGFSKLMRAILEASNHETISIAKEVEILQAYLALEKLRFGPAFQYHIALQADVAWDQCEIPPMLLQPILENAIWHGLQLQKDAPTLWLRLGRTMDGSICIEVEDNGIGRKAAAQIERKYLGPSMAIANIQERIRLLNATRPEPVSMAIEDLQNVAGDARGTLVRIYLPQPKYHARNY